MGLQNSFKTKSLENIQNCKRESLASFAPRLGSQPPLSFVLLTYFPVFCKTSFLMAHLHTSGGEPSRIHIPPQAGLDAHEGPQESEAEKTNQSSYYFLSLCFCLFGQTEPRREQGSLSPRSEDPGMHGAAAPSKRLIHARTRRGLLQRPQRRACFL